MEGGSVVVEWITYGIIAFLLLALGLLFLRTAWFFLSLLAIPLTDTLGRTRVLRGAVRRWGERGPDGHATLLDPAAEDAAAAAARAQPGVPAAVRAGLRVGAAVGVTPGLWMAVRGARLALERGSGAADVLGAVGTAIGFVAAAGVIVGATAGVLVGLLVDAVRARR